MLSEVVFIQIIYYYQIFRDNTVVNTTQGIILTFSINRDINSEKIDQIRICK